MNTTLNLSNNEYDHNEHYILFFQIVTSCVFLLSSTSLACTILATMIQNGLIESIF